MRPCDLLPLRTGHRRARARRQVRAWTSYRRVEGGRSALKSTISGLRVVPVEVFFVALLERKAPLDDPHDGPADGLWLQFEGDRKVLVTAAVAKKPKPSTGFHLG